MFNALSNFSEEEREEIIKVVEKVTKLATTESEITIDSDEFAFLELAGKECFPDSLPYRRIEGRELLRTGYFAQVGGMKIKVIV